MPETAEAAGGGRRPDELYAGGGYAARNPAWHVPEAPWKVEQVVRMLARHALRPATVGDVGCGAGEMLRLLQARLDPACELWGYDIASHALALAAGKANERLHFRLADLTREADARFDLLLALDVVEHVEDCFAFLRALRPKGRYTLFELPLDLSVQALLRNRLVHYREQWGHRHHFTKETALRLLAEAGYAVVDHRYTSVPADSRLRWALRLPAAVHEDWAVRVLGGRRLLVLAQ